eukprot:COSAG02_NODE_51659_length_312_cov_1.577465_1_plen_53_part_01
MHSFGKIVIPHAYLKVQWILTSGKQASLRLWAENALIFPLQSTQNHSLFDKNH